MADDGGILGFLKELADTVKATDEAIKATQDLLDSPRSVVCELDNTTSLTLHHDSDGHDHGGFRTPPPFSVLPSSNSLFGSQSSGLATGTQGFVRYRLDDEGTSLVVSWDIPFAGSNSCDCHVEGPHADWYIVDHICGNGNQGAQMRYLLGERVAFAPRQADWRFCRKCEAMFFDGSDTKGVCPAPSPSSHEAAGFNFTLPHDTPGPGQRDWRFCGKCEAMFFDGSPDKGICPAGGNHAAAGFNFTLPHDTPGVGQADWRFCGKCKAMFFDGSPNKGICPAGGNHAAAGFNFTLPHDIPGPGQRDWRFCHKCEVLFFDGSNSKGVCAAPSPSSHEAAGFNFDLPHDIPGQGQADWRFCSKCEVLFFDGYPDKGICPAGGNHAAVGFNFRFDHS